MDMPRSTRIHRANHIWHFARYRGADADVAVFIHHDYTCVQSKRRCREWLTRIERRECSGTRRASNRSFQPPRSPIKYSRTKVKLKENSPSTTSTSLIPTIPSEWPFRSASQSSNSRSTVSFKNAPSEISCPLVSESGPQLHLPCNGFDRSQSEQRHRRPFENPEHVFSSRIQ